MIRLTIWHYLISQFQCCTHSVHRPHNQPLTRIILRSRPASLTYSSYCTVLRATVITRNLTIAKLDSGVQDGHQQQWTSEKKKNIYNNIYITLSHTEALPWRVKSIGIRQSKMIKVAGFVWSIGGKGSSTARPRPCDGTNKGDWSTELLNLARCLIELLGWKWKFI